ncbi:MAG: glucoamylase family protein [bacterium]
MTGKRFFLVSFVVLSLLCSLSVAQQKTNSLKTDPFLNELHYRTFRWFWDVTDPSTGLVPDRWPTLTFSSVAAIGFGLTAYGVGAEHAYIPRDSAAMRVLATLEFLYKLPQHAKADAIGGYQGFFYHFLKLDSGHRLDARDELSTIDTALLIAGALFCQSYFDRPNKAERRIRALADSLYRRVNWKWFQVKGSLLSMSWTPEGGYNPTRWMGYSEGMILYILGLGSPTYPLHPDAWKEWTRSYVWSSYYGPPFVSFGPLFGHQYSHLWIDFRGIQDDYMKHKGIDYFENSRCATYSQRAYATENPKHYSDYSARIWGLSACDGPASTTMVIDGVKRTFVGYAARGCSVDWTNDDGTIAPTAAGGSVMIAPEICIPALQAMKEQYGANLYTTYGFLDSFNPSFRTPDHPDGWFNKDYLGIDQGPILLSIENLRTELIWKQMKKNPYIIRGLKRAGFSGGWLDKKN